ncbi:hypothetical protein [Tellurirhabdus bombi]|uniref:hypothetical protein n=1 Tax=Tellurirhabdus bombi TaxID=2907205 RepID=UPI001F19FA6A|nr:hypothetical protein [Tellurirhabdus bombi]
MNTIKWILWIGCATSVWLFLSAFGLNEPSRPVAPTPTSLPDSLQKDPETGLIVDSQLMLVKSQCTACHSSKLILQNRFTRDGWKEKIRWMQRTQNLWDLGKAEPPVLDYLAKYYGPEAKTFDGRRKPVQSVQWYKLQ